MARAGHQQTPESPSDTFLARFVPGPTERTRIVNAGRVLLILTVLSLLPLVTGFPQSLRHHFSRGSGLLAVVGILLAAVIYPMRLLLRVRTPRLQPVASALFARLRVWHVPLALVAIGLALIHTVLALLGGVSMSGATLTGIALSISIGAQVVSGFMRYKRVRWYWHLALGICTLVLLGYHMRLSMPGGGK